MNEHNCLAAIIATLLLLLFIIDLLFFLGIDIIEILNVYNITMGPLQIFNHHLIIDICLWFYLYQLR